MRFYELNTCTLQDYPDKIAMMAFTAGCNFRCRICHNHHLLSKEITDRLGYWFAEDIAEHVARSAGWIEGVCISGGEPFIHEGLFDALRTFKRAGLSVKVDTNGSFPVRLIGAVSDGLVDYVAMDVKAPLNEESMMRVTGVSNRLDAIRESIGILKRSGIEYEFRTVCVPAFHMPDDIGKIAREVAPCRAYTLLPFDPKDALDPEMRLAAAPTEAQMNEYLAAARHHVPDAVAYVRGLPAPRPHDGGGGI